MIENTLTEMFKKYVNIFINEYQNYLSKDQLEILKNINYKKIIVIDNIDVPFGLVNFGKIHLSSISNDLIKKFQEMDNYNISKYNLNNKNISTYLKYMCDNGYTTLEFFGDILMYFVFELVIKNHSILNHGLINQEIKLLSIKYSIRCANLYAKEEAILTRVTPIFHINNLRRILFMDMPTSFKFINDTLGYRYANLFEEMTNIVDKKYQDIKNKEYKGINGFLNYADDYDKITYGDVYNHLLDFEIENHIKG